MNGRTFVDTNVLVYYVAPAEGVKHERAREVIGKLWDGQFGVLSPQVLQEFYVTVTRKLRTPLEPDVARMHLRYFGTWPLVLPSLSLVLAATMTAERHQISFWDAMVLESARAGGAATVLSEDLQDGRDYRGIRVMNPFAPEKPATGAR